MIRSFPSVAVPDHLRRKALAIASVTALLTLAACGGGGGDAGASASSGGAIDAGRGLASSQAHASLDVDGPQDGRPAVPNEGIDFSAEQNVGTLPVADEAADVNDSVVARKALPVAAKAATEGAWGGQMKWAFIPIHAVVLPDGRVMTYGSTDRGEQGAKFYYDVWDPTLGGDEASHLTLPNTTQTDIFCSAQVVLPLTGDVFIAGGDIYSDARGRSINQPINDTTIFRPGSNTIEAAAKMQRKRWYATATTLPNGEVFVQGGKGGNDHPEIRRNDGSNFLLSGITTSDLREDYPRNWVAPDGNIFGFSKSQMYRMKLDGNGTRTDLGTLNYKSDWEGSAVMFEPGRILLTEALGNRAAIIDIRGDKPVVTDAGTMSNTRMWHNSTVLADGTVAISGGAEYFDFHKATARNPIYHLEFWNPKTGVWTRGPSQKRMRLYHSTATLLPDGSLFTGGGGAYGPESNLNAEVYYPAYLYNADGTPAQRPTLDKAPMVVQPGGSMVLESAQAETIRRVTMVATGSVTHSFNMNQRFIELSFRREGNRLVAKLPSNVNDTPPGYYMVFILNEAGTPSISKMVRVNVAGQATVDPDVVPIYRYAANDGTSLRYRYSPDPALGGEWVRQGEAFLAYASQKNNTVPVYRYSATTGGKVRYKYTTDGSLRSAGWLREGIAFYAYNQPGEGRTGVDEYKQVRGGWYLNYATAGNSAGSGWEFAGHIFHVPASRAQKEPEAPRDTEAPSVPGGVHAQAQGNDAVQLSWGKSSDAGGSGLAGYRVRRDGMDITPNLLQTESLIDRDLKPGDYSYTVEAVDGAGNTSAVSARVQVTLRDAQAERDAALAAANLVRVYRYVAPGGDGDLRYVYSADASVSGEWTRQELAFYAYAKPQRNTVPVYRYLARGADGTARYLFSINPWLGNGWTREHVVFHVLRYPQRGAQAVNEFYRMRDGWYLGYSTQSSFGESGSWRRYGRVFYVPTFNEKN
ncbi:galactose oxidase-like domain-containing protein [Lautropia mirabilis ATCC 51599]|uniref:Fibronectin type III domain protein n=1 Tax=Lautropia mirabilis ATCC 51599 TaxID=887898 RepID=E7RTJ8_9BURK|nr:galactose oxidase-like domain-containing protein [Lautropia mirabilis]EFV96084.1 fibronectin type III domain protein [Lautropia mirabilis ATCC 51599]VEH03542.1 Exoglucanase B precursor [Lautropia mirabilis]